MDTAINSFFFNYTTQLACIAFLSIFLVAWRYNKLSLYPLFSLLVWYAVSFANMFPVRQSIAVALFVFSWKYIQERRLLSYLVIIFIAATFHLTALIVLPVYFIWYKRYFTRFYIYSIIVLSFISLTFQSFISDFIFAIGGEFFQNKLEFYINENAESTFGSVYSPNQIIIRGIINRSLFFFIPLWLLCRTRVHNDNLNAMLNLYCYSFVLFLIVVPISPALGRLGVYTDMSQALLLPYIFSLKMSKASLYIILAIVILYLIIRFKGVVFNYYDLYIPYHSVFDKL